jgi:hypothetical protein
MTSTVKKALVTEGTFDNRSPAVSVEGGPAWLGATEGVPLIRRTIEQIDLQETNLSHENCGQAGQAAADSTCANHVPTLG